MVGVVTAVNQLQRIHFIRHSVTGDDTNIYQCISIVIIHSLVFTRSIRPIANLIFLVEHTGIVELVAYEY
jgi:hypothetical protein